ncbi:MAG: universal stress protein [Methyloligellaceae bacterium]
MPYKTILAYLARPGAIQGVMGTALPLAEKFGAHLIGMHVCSGTPLAGTMGAQVPPEIIEQYAQHRREEAAAIKDAFSKAVKGAKVQTEWRQPDQTVLGTDILHLISGQTRYADIVVMGQPSSEQRLGELTADIIIAAGRPVLVVPNAGGFSNAPQRVVVAWNGSREAARAAYDALPLLKEAQSVSVVTTHSGKGAVTPKSEEMAHTLARHGVKAEAVLLDKGGASTGEAMNKFASEQDCDLLVMGCYGHSRLRERLFGGATRHFLQNMILPVLMSH